MSAEISHRSNIVLLAKILARTVPILAIKKLAKRSKYPLSWASKIGIWRSWRDYRAKRESRVWHNITQQSLNRRCPSSVKQKRRWGCCVHAGYPGSYRRTVWSPNHDYFHESSISTILAYADAFSDLIISASKELLYQRYVVKSRFFWTSASISTQSL